MEGNKTKRHFIKEDKQMAKNHTKRGSTSLVIREMENSKPQRNYYIPIRMAKVKKKKRKRKLTIASANKCAEQQRPTPHPHPVRWGKAAQPLWDTAHSLS